MSEKRIPDENLAIFLQNYSVHINDAEGNKVGEKKYSTVGVIPSDNPEKPVWQLILTGHLQPNVDKCYIVYDISDSNYIFKNTVTFENAASGTFNICGKVLDANKIVKKYEYSDEKSILTIEIDTKAFDFRLKKRTHFSYQLYLDDSTNANVINENYNDSTGTIYKWVDGTWYYGTCDSTCIANKDYTTVNYTSLSSKLQYTNNNKIPFDIKTHSFIGFTFRAPYGDDKVKEYTYNNGSTKTFDIPYSYTFQVIDYFREKGSRSQVLYCYFQEQQT